ncbi:MAG: hypothetical protein ACK56F_15525, partial [bacterium]
MPNPPAAQWPKPSWMVIPEAETNRDFYECVALSEVARYNPGPEEAIYKKISILFGTHHTVQGLAEGHGCGAAPYRAKDGHHVDRQDNGVQADRHPSSQVHEERG